MSEQPLRVSQHLLVCPVCKGRLACSSDLIVCEWSDHKFSQISSDYFDLLPHHLLKNDGEQWGDRQQEMEEWYKDLIANPTAANHCFVNDYTPYASFLAALSGDVLDLGGGIGIVRDYLPHNTEYIVIDPSLEWLGAEWDSLAEDFPSLKAKPYFVRGVGEYLPFPAQVFDAVLSFWSLNHVSDPESVFGEVHRVLRPGGSFLVVLEDMAPSWGDVANGTFPASRVAIAGGDPSRENPRHPDGKEWPLQSDHLRIYESDIQTWVSQRFEITWRGWVGQFLTFKFTKVESQWHFRASAKSTEVQRIQHEIHILRNERSDFIRRLQSLEQEIRYWQEQSGYTSLNKLRDHVREREWGRAMRGVLVLMRHPRTFALAFQQALRKLIRLARARVAER